MASLKIMRIYERLLRAYGHQGWWPTTPPGGTEAVYQPGRSRKLTSEEKFEVCVGAILAQNTSWNNARRAIANLHKKKMMSPKAIARAKMEALRECVRPAGYFNLKGDYLRSFATRVCEQHGGDVTAFLEVGADALRKELLGLKGVGPETADSILLYGSGKPVFVVDAYTKRIGERTGLLSEGATYDLAQRLFEAALPHNVGLYQEYHALLVKHAKEKCVKYKPKCSGCVLKGICAYGRKTD